MNQQLMLYCTISELKKCHDSLLSVPLSKEVTQKLYTEKGNHIEYQLQNVDCVSVHSRLFTMKIIVQPDLP